jgi:NAD(P)-dependent dehydrogenase (short-subunit alcohol dehydrogenase family)
MRETMIGQIEIPQTFPDPGLVDGKRVVISATITGHTAQGCWGAPTDLAGAYQFLTSDASAFITGTVLSVDRGCLLV